MTAKDLTIAYQRNEPSAGPAIAQTGMDRPVARSAASRWLKLAAAVLLAIIVAVLLWTSFQQGRSLTVQGERLSIASVAAGSFEDFIPLRARVVPLSTVYLDAVQGGRVEQVLVEDGVMTAAGDLIIRMSNSDLQLSVMSTESRVIEQLNTMRDQELRLEQNRLGHKRSLVDINYNIQRLRRDLGRQQELLAKDHISQAEYDAFVDELSYYEQRHAVTLESQASDAKLMQSQLTFFQEKSAVMEDNLAFARKSLEELNVRAPVAGRLSGFDMEVGQQISRGDRIGQIDNPAQFKLSANIDEYYLNRVDIDQPVHFKRGRDEYRLRVAKIYPDVSNGQFEVDLQFVDAQPKDIRRGQSVQARLRLGDTSQAKLIPNGTFYQDTGGQWIYVISADGKQAVKRSVQLGRRNKQFIEVISGLDEGEQVIVSSYNAFKDVDRLKLSND